MKRRLLTFLLAVLIIPVSTFASIHTTYINLFDKTKDSIASISITINSTTSPIPAVHRGVGFVESQDGYIITASHLFQGNIKEIEVVVSKNNYKARLIGKDDKTDVALIKIDGVTNFKPLVLGDSDALKIGEYIAAVGDPFGLTLSITHGIISGKKRNVGLPMDEFIQHDAPINPGNSGGPLLNLLGEAVGMNTVLVQGNNTSLAIPVNLIKKIVPMLKQNGRVTRSWLGAEIQDAQYLTSKKIKELKLSPSVLRDKNTVVVTRVLPRSPAEKAGLKIGDIIRGYNGKKAKGAIELSREISFQKVDIPLVIVIERNEQLMTVYVKLAQSPD